MSYQNATVNVCWWIIPDSYQAMSTSALANAKRPCNCHVLCSCAHSISDMTSFGCCDQGRDSVAQCSECERQEIKKARVNGRTDNDSTVDVINIAADHQIFMTLTGELSWQRLRRSAVDFYSKNEKSLCEPPFLGNVWLVGKPVVDFIFVVIKLFCYLLRLRHYKRKCVEVGVFRRGGTLCRFQREGGIAHQPEN